MVLTKRIIPCLDVTEGRVVKGVKFVKLKDARKSRKRREVCQIEGCRRRR
ncbi:MAG: hypothetical protein BAJALOKI3v1_400019 [Promethearchaeota archaeon]|nr:MAG: hypothetical protein BAJALOKI3v1_400019 [Candidatus Lokiarchaeota archaeon]